MQDKYKQFYNSKEWKQKRLQILTRDNFECQDCRAKLLSADKSGIELERSEAKINRAEQVHHIIELKDNFDLALCDDNLISLCIDCHNKRHGRTGDKVLKKYKKRFTNEEKW